MSDKKRGRPRKPVEETPPSQSAAMPEFNEDESPLLWLAKRKDKNGQPMISVEEYNAGERLRADFFFALMTPRTTLNWSMFDCPGSNSTGAPDLGPEVQEGVQAAQERVRDALRAAGPGLADVLIDVCCHLRGLEAFEKTMFWPQRTGKIILRIALQHLAIHYGMASDPRWDKPRAVNRWGADDYRPKAGVLVEGVGAGK